MPNPIIVTLTDDELDELPHWLEQLLEEGSVKSGNAGRIDAVIQKLRAAATPGGQWAALATKRDLVEQAAVDDAIAVARRAQLAALAATIASGVIAVHSDDVILNEGLDEPRERARQRIADASLDIARRIIDGAEK